MGIQIVTTIDLDNKKDNKKEYDKKEYRKQIISSGIMLGVAIILPIYICWIFNNYDTTLGGYSTLLQFATAFAIFIIGGRKAATIYDPTGEKGFSYGKAYGFSILVSLIGGLVSSILMIILYDVIDPSFVQKTMEAASLKLEQDPQYTPEMIEMGLKWSKIFTKAYILIPMNIIGMTFTGALVALISSLLVKKNPQL